MLFRVARYTARSAGRSMDAYGCLGIVAMFATIGLLAVPYVAVVLFFLAIAGWLWLWWTLSHRNRRPKPATVKRAAPPTPTVPRTAPQPAGPTPQRRRRGEPDIVDLYRELLGMVLGDHARADRLIAYERSRSPGMPIHLQITRAIERIRSDLR
jgi:hypothetical protein